MTAAPTDPGAPFDPRAWQGRLAGLLARLDHLRSELEGRRLGADAGWLLDKAEAMVQAADDLSRAAALPPALAAAEAAAVARAGAFFSAAYGVRERLHTGLFRSVVSALAGPKDQAEGVGPAVRGGLEAAEAALGAYFALFTARFPSSAAARGWVDAATAFLGDFKQLVRGLPE